ncbi:MAG: hypothetical protein WCL50_00670 [Spirochaetota bacterium]
MSHEDLRSDIEFALSELDRELVSTGPLFALVERGELDTIHTMAAAALLHSAYNAIEAIFAMIQKHMDGRLLESTHWHRELLDAMTLDTANRRAVISQECCDLLEDYLAFRHRFRHGYGWQLDPAKVGLKLKMLPSVLDRLRREIECFLKTLK